MTEMCLELDFLARNQRVCRGRRGLRHTACADRGFGGLTDRLDLREDDTSRLSSGLHAARIGDSCYLAALGFRFSRSLGLLSADGNHARTTESNREGCDRTSHVSSSSSMPFAVTHVARHFL